MENSSITEGELIGRQDYQTDVTARLPLRVERKGLKTAHKLLKLHDFHLRGFAAKTHPYTHQKVAPGSIP